MDPAIASPTAAPEAILATCRQGIAEAQTALAEVLATKAAPSVATTLEKYNDLGIALGKSMAMAGLFSEVHPSEAVREAARTCEQEGSKFASELSLNRDLYDVLVAIDVSKENADTKRFVEFTLRDFRRAGVDKDAATRDRLKAIDEEMTKLSQDFSKRLAEDTRSIEIDPKELAGLPADYVAAHAPGPSGKVTITTDYPDYLPFMSYAESDSAKKAIYIKARTRGGMENEATLAQILGLRAEKAKILGFANWADYITADKMIGSGKNARDFIERVWKLADKRADRDYKELLAQLQQTDKKAKAVGDWQKTLLEEQVKTAKYKVSSQDVRQYFAYDTVLAGLLDITSTIYDIEYLPVPGAVTWHADVKVFDVVRKSTRQDVGRIYLDMHPREGKYKHAAQFTVRDGVAGRVRPEGVLVCNFPQPKGDDVGLMEHDDVVTMFHEFGHLMHHVLGGGQRWVRQSGVATEWDFVEAPSQMFEEWAWSYQTLARFAKHYKTGEVIPEALVGQMRKANKFGLGTQVAQQMFYASLALTFHSEDPSKLKQLDTVKRLQDKYTPFRYVEGTHFHTTFGHLVGYSAMYYTYMWSLVIAKDLLTPFAKNGLLDPTATAAYRDKILAPGGTKDAADLVKDFLGRPYSFAAFEKYLSE
ncbi:MAG: Zn-dependent oligopeptidase [Myxococcales bacterium]|nr:Zn-dependent oligopeptidase [Myxococcales bacterium]